MRAVIIGGEGKMGRAFGDLLHRLGYRVVSLEQDDWKQADTLLAPASIVLVSVPMQKTEAVIAKAAPFLSKNTLLVDIASVKQAPLNAMLSHYSGPVLALHPMFGPTIQFSSANQVAKPYRIVNCGDDTSEQAAVFIESLASLGFEIMTITAEEHDVLTAYIQGLHYFTVFMEAYFSYCNGELPLQPMSIAKDHIIKNAGDELRTMFTDSGKYALYEGLLFACEERKLLYRNFLTIADRFLQGDQATIKNRFLKNARCLDAYFSQFIRSSQSEVIDLDAASSRLHYFLIFCEAFLLCENAIHLNQLLRIATSNYLGKIDGMIHLLSISNREQIADLLFNNKTIPEYRQAITAMEWVNSNHPEKQFSSIYPKISQFIKNVQASCVKEQVDLNSHLPLSRL